MTRTIVVFIVASSVALPLSGCATGVDVSAREPRIDGAREDASSIDEADGGVLEDGGVPDDAPALDASALPDATIECAGATETCASTEDCCGDLLCLDGQCGYPMCLDAIAPCATDDQCCDDRSCATTSAGHVCCGAIGATCTTSGGEDCCGALSCRSGQCVSTRACASPCFAAPALDLERSRLAAIGGSFLGICGDAAHTYGFHVPAARLPSSDYSLRGEANVPVCAWHGCAIDIGMNWPASRDWLRWLIAGIIAHRITGVAEVIGSYDGSNVRYWSDSSGWTMAGTAYTGSGHDTWSHVSIYRSTALDDHRILAGWTASSGPP